MGGNESALLPYEDNAYDFVDDEGKHWNFKKDFGALPNELIWYVLEFLKHRTDIQDDLDKEWLEYKLDHLQGGKVGSPEFKIKHSNGHTITFKFDSTFFNGFARSYAKIQRQSSYEKLPKVDLVDLSFFGTLSFVLSPDCSKFFVVTLFHGHSQTKAYIYARGKNIPVQELTAVNTLKSFHNGESSLKAFAVPNDSEKIAVVRTKNSDTPEWVLSIIPTKFDKDPEDYSLFSGNETYDVESITFNPKGTKVGVLIKKTCGSLLPPADDLYLENYSNWQLYAPQYTYKKYIIPLKQLSSTETEQ